MHKLLILGATSPIARKLLWNFAAEGGHFYLGGRDATELERIAADTSLRFSVTVDWAVFDALQMDRHREYLELAVDTLGGLTCTVVAFGFLGEQMKASGDFDYARKIIDTNFTGACSIITHVANLMKLQGSGMIVGISSVAGDRAKRSNYVYGAAKGGFTLFLQGLRNRLNDKGVSVLTVKPGFVDTRMTYGMPGMFLVAKPEKVAGDIFRAIKKERDVIYTPSFWRMIMTAVRFIPERFYKRLPF